jgi:hypothetical protein
MSDQFTCGVAVGTELGTHKAVIHAIVRRSGILFTFRSPLGEETRKQLPVSVDQYSQWLNGESIQNCMYMLNADDRELFLTGMAW